MQHLDINGRILAAVTDKGVIGVYDVHTPKKPKSLGSTGKFYELASVLAHGTYSS